MRRVCLTALAALIAAPRLLAGAAPVPWPPGGTPPLAAFALERDGSGWALTRTRGLYPLYCAGDAFRRQRVNRWRTVVQLSPRLHSLPNHQSPEVRLARG